MSYRKRNHAFGTHQIQLLNIGQCILYQSGPNTRSSCPVQVTVAGQVLPVLASIRLQLTTTRLSFQPAAVKFGQCNLGEKTGVPVQLTNHSRLPQKFGELGDKSDLLTKVG